jgi:hypothetical protein
MGLDQHILLLSRTDYMKYRKKDIPEGQQVDFLEYDHDYAGDKYAYWRKNYKLHRWMHDLYNEKHGIDIFNTNPLILEKADIERLLEDMKNDKLVENPEVLDYNTNYKEDEDYKIYIQENKESDIKLFEDLLNLSNNPDIIIYYIGNW